MENSQNFEDQFHDTGNFAIFSNQIWKNKLNLKIFLWIWNSKTQSCEYW